MSNRQHVILWVGFLIVLLNLLATQDWVHIKATVFGSSTGHNTPSGNAPKPQGSPPQTAPPPPRCPGGMSPVWHRGRWLCLIQN